MLKKMLTFFIWNLMVAFTSSIFMFMDSWWDRRPGNFPALFKPGPNKRGICFISASLAKNASYRFANFLTNFLFLLSFFKASTSIKGTLATYTANK